MKTIPKYAKRNVESDAVLWSKSKLLFSLRITRLCFSTDAKGVIMHLIMMIPLCPLLCYSSLLIYENDVAPSKESTLVSLCACADALLCSIVCPCTLVSVPAKYWQCKPFILIPARLLSALAVAAKPTQWVFVQRPVCSVGLAESLVWTTWLAADNSRQSEESLWGCVKGKSNVTVWSIFSHALSEA